MGQERSDSIFGEWGAEWRSDIPHGDYKCPREGCGFSFHCVIEQCRNLAGFTKKCPPRSAGRIPSAGGLILKCPHCGWLFWFHVTEEDIKKYAKLCDHWARRKKGKALS